MRKFLSSVLRFILELLAAGMILIPLMLLELPWPINSLILAGVFYYKAVGGFVHVVVWVWSFIILVQRPFDAYTVIWIVFFVLNLIPYIGSVVFTCISKKGGDSNE